MDYLVYAFLFFLPFERYPSFEFHGVTIRLSIILVLLGLILVIPRFIMQKKLKPFSLMDKWITFYFAIAVLSSLFASQHGRSTEVLAFILMTIAGYVLVSRSFRKKFDATTVLRFVVASGVFTSLFGLYQFIGDGLGLSLKYTLLAKQYSKVVFGFPRVQAFSLEPLYFANFLLLPIIFLIVFLLVSQRTARWYEYLSLYIMSTAFFFTLSRGAYGALLIASLVFIGACFYFNQRVRNVVPILAVVALAVVSTLGGIKAFSGKQGVTTFSQQAVVVNKATTAASVTPRLLNYREAFRLFKTRPVLGIGIGNYGVFNTVNPHTAGGDYMIVNNQYLESLAETGIFGLIGFLGIIVSAFLGLHTSLKADKGNWAALALAMTLVAILVQYNFLSTIYIFYVWAVLGLIEARTFSS